MSLESYDPNGASASDLVIPVEYSVESVECEKEYLPVEGLEALREAIAMGTDQAILLNDDAFKGGDSLATARVLAAGIKKIEQM